MRLFFCLVVLLTACPAVARAEPVTEADLRRHIEILASDEFGGRKPGTEGENKTVSYIATRWARAGLIPAADNASWYAPVELVERAPVSQTIKLTLSRDGRDKNLSFRDDQIILRGQQQYDSISNGQLVYVGYGVNGAAELEAIVSGKIALIPLRNPPGREDIPDYQKRKEQLIAAGAWGILTIVDRNRPWQRPARRYRSSAATLEGAHYHAKIEGLISGKQLGKWFKMAGMDAEQMFEDAKGDEFLPVALPIHANLSVETAVRSYPSHNVIGKIAGTDPRSGAVLFLGHWDHFGTCRSPDAAVVEQDLICNGAVDNASGIALLIETAKRLAGTRPDRDLYFLATTAEEQGLLGAYAFAANPPFPLDRLVAVFNADTVALAPDGRLIAVVGRGQSALDADIEKIAEAQGREIDTSDNANAYLKRQDGYVFLERNIPAYMITSAFSDQERLEAFLNGPYHGVSDEAGDQLLLGGAADDADFHVALGRYFGSTETYPQKATSE